MKKINLFVIGLSIVFSIFSCSSNDSNSNTQNYSDLIKGEWNYISQSINDVPTDFDHECRLSNEYQEYFSNGNYKQIEYDNPTGNGCEPTDIHTATWEIMENTIIYNFSGVEYTVEIVELNQNNFSYSENYQGNETITNLERRN